MKIAVFGSRHGVSRDVVVDYLRPRFDPRITVVSGGAPGVDSFAEQGWQSLGGHVISLRPRKLENGSWAVERWETEAGLYWIPDDLPTFEDFTSAATFRDMLLAEEGERGVAFRHARSRGTGHTIDFFAAAGKPCAVHEV